MPWQRIQSYQITKCRSAPVAEIRDQREMNANNGLPIINYLKQKSFYQSLHVSWFELKWRNGDELICSLIKRFCVFVGVFIFTVRIHMHNAYRFEFGAQTNQH